ncbi:MAG: hypothetical protein N2690_08545, partial [Rhodocyclaceae bacterium]|nr:hypothetical protein [Rhodocyclaceae bacterium]
EYEVMQGGLVRVLKQPAVVLRLGPRTAFVEHADIEIIGLSGFVLPAPLAQTAAAPEGHGMDKPQTSSSAGKSTPEPAAAPRTAEDAPQHWVIDLNAIEDGLQLLRSVGVRDARLMVCHGPSVQDARRAARLAQALRDLGAALVRTTDACHAKGQATVSKL